ncbi:hypothetical protein [Paenarthrobacter ureafaciens]|uniref:hypothetical protein n=1 Tax=Paenarthrobacter ureafaciens TaxID=37931 RepID=UPI001C2BAFEC|nr:hypothetical protein [Paenarthrobacter ureafaciens]
MHELETQSAVDTVFHPPAKTVLAEDWSCLSGFEVEIRRGKRVLRTAKVETTSPDGNLIWIARVGVNERRLILKSEGYDLWVTPNDDRRARRKSGKSTPGIASSS